VFDIPAWTPVGTAIRTGDREQRRSRRSRSQADVPAIADENPRTGRIVAMSVVRALPQRNATVVIG
jgi:hypothetical protein